MVVDHERTESKLKLAGRAGLAVGVDMSERYKFPTRTQEKRNLFFADPFKPLKESNIKLLEFRRVAVKPSGFLWRGVPATHGVPIVPPIHQPPRPRRVVGSAFLPIGMGPNLSARVWAKPFRVPRRAHLPHDPSFHCFNTESPCQVHVGTIGRIVVAFPPLRRGGKESIQRFPGLPGLRPCGFRPA